MIDTGRREKKEKKKTHFEWFKTLKSWSIVKVLTGNVVHSKNIKEKNIQEQCASKIIISY